MPSSIHTKKNTSSLKPHRVLKSGRRPGQTSRNGRGLKYNSSKRDNSISHVVAKSGLALLTLENSEALVNARRKEKKTPKREAYRAAKKAARRERGAAKAGMAVEESGMGTVEGAAPVLTVDTKSGAQKKKKKAALKELARKVKLEQQQGDVEMEC